MRLASVTSDGDFAYVHAWLRFRGGRFIDRDFDDAVRLALRGLIHESTA